jgi:hypothetical protein
MGNPLIVDGDYTTPRPQGQPKLSAPFPGVNTEYMLTQDFIQYGPGTSIQPTSGYAYKPLALNTVYGADFTTINSFPNFFLTAEGPLEDLGGGLVKWTRTYCAKPATRYEAASLSYLYPGLTPKITVGGSTDSVTIRSPILKAADVRIEYDYFFIGAAGSNLATPDYADFTDIPPNTHQRWGFVAFNGASPIGLVEINPPILYDQITFNGIFYGGGTVPTASAYIALMGTLNATTGVITPPNPPNFFVAEDSVLTRWQGNVFQRATKYIPYL